jgi:hypothetical protein
MKSSSHSPIPFLPLFCNCELRRLDSIQFLCSQAHILAGWRLETRFYSTTTEVFFIRTLHGPRRKYSLSVVGEACLQRRCMATEFIRPLLRIRCRGNVFTESLPSNERLFWLHYSGFRASCHNTVVRTFVLHPEDWSGRTLRNATLRI